MRKPSIVGTAKEAALRALSSTRKALSVDDIYLVIAESEDRRSIPALYIAIGQMCEAGLVATSESPTAQDIADLKQGLQSRISDDIPVARSSRQTSYFTLTDKGRDVVSALRVMWSLRSARHHLEHGLDKASQPAFVRRLAQAERQQKMNIDSMGTPPAAKTLPARAHRGRSSKRSPRKRVTVSRLMAAAAG